MWTFTCRPSTWWDEPKPELRRVRLIRRLGWTLSGLIGALGLFMLLTGCTDLRCRPALALKPMTPAVGMDSLGLTCERRFP